MPVGQEVMPTNRLPPTDAAGAAPAAAGAAAGSGAATAGAFSGAGTSAVVSGGSNANADPITSRVLRIASLVEVSKRGLPANRAGSIRMSVAKITTSALAISS